MELQEDSEILTEIKRDKFYKRITGIPSKNGRALVGVLIRGDVFSIVHKGKIKFLSVGLHDY